MIQIDYSLLLQIINFLVLIVILNALLYKPLLAILDRRNDRMANEREEINRLNKAVEEKISAYEEKVRATKVEALGGNKILIKEGSDQAKYIVEQVSKEIFALSEQFHEKLQQEVQIARKTLGNKSRMISSDIAEKVLGRSLQ